MQRVVDSPGESDKKTALSRKRKRPEKVEPASCVDCISDDEIEPHGCSPTSRESSLMAQKIKEEEVRENQMNLTRSSEINGSTFPDDAAVEPRRFKQPTLAVFGLADPKKEIAERDAQIEELKEKISTLESEGSHKDSHIVLVEKEIEIIKEKMKRFQSALKCEMIRAAKQSKAEARRLLHQRHFELGQIVTWSATGREVWVEGNTMRELIVQLEEVKKRRDEVEVLKKDAQAQIKQLLRYETKDDAANSTEMTLMQAYEEQQLRSAEHTSLTNAIAHIEMKQAQLKNEKRAFLKEIRRVSEEDASEFMAVTTFGKDGRYVLMKLLGKGGFSEVWQAFDVEEGRYVACKIHHVQAEWTNQLQSHYVRHARRELDIMRQVRHPHVTQLYEVFEYSNTMFVSVMEFSRGMDLDTYLKRYHTLREADARLILLQMVGALRYLASLECPVIHYDLKPANILLHSDDPSVLEVKITDFGLSKIINQSKGPSNNPSIELTSQGTGTFWYQPPECFVTNTTPLISNKVDVWSLGVMFFQMLYGSRPFADGQSQRDIWNQKLILSSARSLAFPDSPKVSDEARDLITKCLAFNVAERYDIFQVSQHPYLFRMKKKPKPVLCPPTAQ